LCAIIVAEGVSDAFPIQTAAAGMGCGEIARHPNIGGRDVFMDDGRVNRQRKLPG